MTTSRDFGVNQSLVEELYLRWCGNPAAVSETWRRYFDTLAPEELPQLTSPGTIPAPLAAVPAAAAVAPPRPSPSATPLPALPAAEPVALSRDPVPPPPRTELGPAPERAIRRKPSSSFHASSDVLAATELQGRVSALVNAFRVRGHLYASLDPLAQSQRPADELMLERYGLDKVGPDTPFSTGDMAGPATLPLHELVRRLRETYCRHIGAEFTYLEDRDQRVWLQERMESTCNRLDLSEAEQIRILTKLTDAEIFEQFLHTNYVGAKRFSIEGGEGFIPLVDLLVEHSAELGVEEVVIGMAHRGRLNFLANILEKRLHEIFADFEDADPDKYLGRGDVKYHLGYSSDRVTATGQRIHLTMTFNPSHLEFVNPVVEGRARAKQDRRGDGERRRVLPFLVHGDASFAGQGIVTETLNLSELPAYRTGGTIHVVINNQIGFTTLPEQSRSTRYCTDVTRMLRCPVFHVNGEDPESVAQVARLAVEFRQRFHRDVVIDLFCYRKYGHNEGDEPRFTQPRMYAAIDAKKSVREIYVSRLVSTGKITLARAAEIEKARRVDLEAALRETRAGNWAPADQAMQGMWHRYTGGADAGVPEVPTAVPLDDLSALLLDASQVPLGFHVHPKIRRLFRQRSEPKDGELALDWGTAEVVAYASLLVSGTRVRVSGQDTQRGTFSHRHAVVHDVSTGETWTPLAHLAENQGPVEIIDSPLSEQGVLGFELGYSFDAPDALVIWEAQFGDFANATQVFIDQFIGSSEDKWHRLSGLVLLLPHGFEGQGPEHSSARLERFLTLCAEDNLQVCNLTTPAQLFHCLRRQVLRPYRKPLVIMSPKSLLRRPEARSRLTDLAEGGFQRIISDPTVEPSRARRVLLCTGKIYYDLLAGRAERNIPDVPILRLEQIYPLREEIVRQALAAYPDGTDLIWVQEEPWNMGAWLFLSSRLGPMVGPRLPLRHIARPESASPATGSHASHVLEQNRIVAAAFEGLGR